MTHASESELRALWKARGVPAERQAAILAEVTAAAQPGAKVGPFIIGAETPRQLLEVPAFWRPKVRGETRRPQVEARELLAGFTEPMRQAQAERAQGKLQF